MVVKLRGREKSTYGSQVKREREKHLWQSS